MWRTQKQGKQEIKKGHILLGRKWKWINSG